MNRERERMGLQHETDRAHPGHDAQRGRPIVTLTINPALDVSTSVEEVLPEHKLRCGPAHHEAGGGGINVARVVKRLGGHPVAVFASGGSIGEAFNALVNREQLQTVHVPIRGGTRESFTVDETSTGTQYRFVLQGPEVSPIEADAVLAALESTLSSDALVVASGSLPPGVPNDFYARVANLVREHHGQCVVDASGDALANALAEGVFMIKPSLRELEQYVGRALPTDGAKRAAAQQIVDARHAEIVALSLGADGAMLIMKTDALRLPAAPVQVRGTVGAGDSFVAGFVQRLSQGASIEDAFLRAVAAGSATAACASTQLCSAALVDELEAVMRRDRQLVRL